MSATRRNETTKVDVQIAMRALTLVLLTGPTSVAQSQPFTFAGLSLNTSLAELKQRYPRSTVVGEMIYVSAEESHDSISTIRLSSTSAPRSLTLTFEQEQPGGKLSYPGCEKLLTLLTERYGKPTNEVDAQEERALNRRFEWKAPVESLMLACFRDGSQPLYAERLTITSQR